MQYNSHATDLDCVSEVLMICGATSTEYPINDLTRRFNAALDWYYSIAFEADGRHNFDDFNESSPPIDTQNLVSGTNRYKFSDFTETVLSVLRIEVLTSAGKGRFLIPETLTNLGVDTPGAESGRLNAISSDTFQELYLDPASGAPTHYIKYGDFIYLRPSPNYNETDGLKAYFNRPAAYMAATDTTKVPGTPVTHHTILCRKTALPFLIDKNKPQANMIAQMLQQDEQTIRKYFAHRNQDMRARLTVKQESSK